ncbi:MAG: type II toxin-antitoxin system HicA family toxin [Chloroflexota bacterium]
MKVRDLLKRLEDDGWREARRGSHRQIKHPDKPGTVTVAGHPRDELDQGTLASITRQTGIGRWA